MRVITSRTGLLCLLLLLCLLRPHASKAQQDTVQTEEQVKQEKALEKARHKAIYGDARKATIMSACLPGLGQIHNKKYWKAPIIYAALGGFAWWGINMHREYKFYSDNLRREADGDPSTINVTGYSQDQLIVLKNQDKKYMDYAIMGGALIYVLNIVDANVDAHLKTFDVSNDLSLNIRPYSNIDRRRTVYTGLTFKLTFK